MGKKKSKIRSGRGDVVSVGAPLDEQITRARVASSRSEARSKVKRRAEEVDSEKFIDADLSERILSVARKQKHEEERGEQRGNHEKDTAKRMRLISLGSTKKGADSDEEDEDDGHISDNDYDDKIIELDPDLEADLARFTAKTDYSNPSQRTLFDIIQEKIEQKRVDADTALSQVDPNEMQVRQVNPEVTEMYRGVGAVLSKYRSGKIPKAFKIIPKMVNWEQMLYLTDPDKWSAAAMYQATRIFASNLNPRMCQRFYSLVLLPRLRDDIDEFKKLNFHLYQALHKALYKPAAFFKGILLPLCESGTCTLREATIFASVLAKSSIPMLHTAAAMLKMEYSGANSLFLRTLIDKKYTLPYKAIDALAKHFLRFKSDERTLPVLWHQSLLSFVQRYKADITPEHRSAILELIKVKHHYQISPEIRRELSLVQKEPPKPCDRNDTMEF